MSCIKCKYAHLSYLSTLRCHRKKDSTNVFGTKVIAQSYYLNSGGRPKWCPLRNTKKNFVTKKDRRGKLDEGAHYYHSIMGQPLLDSLYVAHKHLRRCEMSDHKFKVLVSLLCAILGAIMGLSWLLGFKLP